MTSKSTSSLRQRLLATLDDSVLEALGSKGLLRRARKDLETDIPIKILRESLLELRIQVGDAEVTIPDAGPAQATCTCATAEVCHHILAACLALRQLPIIHKTSSEIDTLSAEANAQELLSLSPEYLEKWGGRTAWHSALKQVAETETNILNRHGITVEFPILNTKCIFVPGAGLDGAIIAGTKKHDKHLVIAAVLAFQQKLGATIPKPTKNTLTRTRGASRTPEQVLTSTVALLCETVAGGLTRLNNSIYNRFTTLSISAKTIDLPRLSRSLHSISDEIRLILERNATANLERLFVTLARTYALCLGLQKTAPTPSPHLVGSNRSNYSPVGSLDLAGIAAWPWQTASGYRGLTVLFWDTRSNRWNTWSEARPIHLNPKFDPCVRFQQDSPWPGASSIELLSQSHFHLVNARRNAAGQISSSSQSYASILGPTAINKLTLPIYTSWKELIKDFSSTTTVGLTESNPVDTIVIIRPSSFGSRTFNPATQTFHWLLYDEAQEELTLQLQFTILNAIAIETLEHFDPIASPHARILGQLNGPITSPTLHPYAIITADGTLTNIALQSKAPLAQSPFTPPAENQLHDTPNLYDDTEFCTPNIPLTRFLSDVDDTLLALAEHGLACLIPTHRNHLSTLAAQATLLCWDELTTTLQALATQSAPIPESLLLSRYYSLIYRQAL